MILLPIGKGKAGAKFHTDRGFGGLFQARAPEAGSTPSPRRARQ